MKKILLLIINLTFSVILFAQTDMQIILKDLNEVITEKDFQEKIPLEEQMKYSINIQFIKAEYDDKEKVCTIIVSFKQRWAYDSKGDKFHGRHRSAGIVTFYDGHGLKRTGTGEKLIKTDTVYDGDNYVAFNTYEAVHYIDKKDAPNGPFSHKIDVISFFKRGEF